MMVTLWTPLHTRAGVSSLLLLLLTLTLVPLTAASRSTLERLSRALQALEEMVSEPRPCARCCPGGAGGGRRVLTLEELRGDVRGLVRQGVSSRDLLRTVVWELYMMNSASVVQPSFNAFYDEMRTKLVPLEHVGRAHHPDLLPTGGTPRVAPSQGRPAGSSHRAPQGSTNCHTLPSSATQRLEPRRNAASHRDMHINGLLQAAAGKGQRPNNYTNVDPHRPSPGLLAVTRLGPAAVGRRPPPVGQSEQLTASQPLLSNYDNHRVRPPPPGGAPPVGCVVAQEEEEGVTQVAAAPPGGGGLVGGGVGGGVSGRRVSAPTTTTTTTTTRHCANQSVQTTPSHTPPPHPHTPPHSESSSVTSSRHGGTPKEKLLLPITMWRDAAPSRGTPRLPPKPAPLQVIIINPMTGNGVPRTYKQHVTLEPSSGVYDILRKTSLEYEMKAENEFKNNPFIFQLGKFRSICYILRSVMDWPVTTEKYWTITVEDSNRKVVFDDICIPNKHHLPMRPGYTIYLNYSPLPDERRAAPQLDKGGQNTASSQ